MNERGPWTLNYHGSSPINIVVSPHLPIPPTPGADARRIVRHGLADVLAWLGEDIGSKPGEQIHILEQVDPVTSQTTILTSLHGLSRLKEVAR